MGLLNRVWNAVDPFLPDEQIMGLLGRGQQSQGYNSPSPGFQPQGPGPGAAQVTAQRQGPGKLDYLADFLVRGMTPDQVRGEYQRGALADAAQQFKIKQALAQQQALQAFAGKYGGGDQQGAPGAGPGPGPAPAAGLPGVRDVAPDLLKLQAAGVDTSHLLSIFDKASPNLTNVNGRFMDSRDPRNANAFVPQTEKGQEVLYDSQGRPSFIRNIDGSVEAIAQQEGAKANATEAAKAQYDITEVKKPDGSIVQMPRSQAVGVLGGQGAPGAPQGAPAGLGRSQAPSEATYRGERAKASADRLTGIIKDGATARQTSSRLDQISTLVDGLNTGKLTPAQVAANQVLGNFGINFAGLSNAEAAAAIMSKVTVDMMGGSLGTGFSNADRDFVTKMAPQLAMTPQGRNTLVQYLKMGAQNQTKQAEFARKWEQRYGTIDNPDPQGRSFDEQWGRWLETSHVGTK